MIARKDTALLAVVHIVTTTRQRLFWLLGVFGGGAADSCLMANTEFPSLLANLSNTQTAEAPLCAEGGHWISPWGRGEKGTGKSARHSTGPAYAGATAASVVDGD